MLSKYEDDISETGLIFLRVRVSETNLHDKIKPVFRIALQAVDQYQLIIDSFYFVLGKKLIAIKQVTTLEFAVLRVFFKAVHPLKTKGWCFVQDFGSISISCSVAGFPECLVRTMHLRCTARCFL